MKSWAGEIRRHIEAWAARLGPLHWWPRYVYHFTDVHNAVSILQTGRLYSFEVKFVYQEEARPSPVRTWQGTLPDVKSQLSFRIPDAYWGTAILHLDDALAFAGPLVFEDIPF